MKKNSIRRQSSRQLTKACQGPITIGMDLGDKTSRYCVLDSQGGVIRDATVTTTKKGLTELFAPMKRSRIAIEVGGHSPWVSRLLKGLHHEVIVVQSAAGEADQHQQPEG